MMSLKFVKENDKWAIWTTVSEEFIVTDLFYYELVDWYSQYKAERARRNAIRDVMDRMEQIDNDNVPPNYYAAVGLEEAMEDLHE